MANEEDVELKLTSNEKLKIIIERSQVQKSTIARALAYSRQNLNNKLSHDNLKVNEFEKIADLCGYEVILRKKQSAP